MKEGKEQMRMNDRLQIYGLETAEVGGGGDCFFKSIAHRTGISHSKVRQGSANQLRKVASAYDKLGNFKEIGGYKAFCDKVGTPGVFVDGNAEIAAAADFIGKNIFIFGRDEGNDVFIRAGNLGAPTTGDAKGKTIMIAHFCNGEHYTAVRSIQNEWQAPNGSNKDFIHRLNEERTVKSLALKSLIQKAESKLDVHIHDSTGYVGKDEIVASQDDLEHALTVSKAENESFLKKDHDEKKEPDEKKQRSCSNSASSFRAVVFFIFAALFTLMGNLPAVGGNFTFSEVQTSPQGSRSQQMLHVSPGGTLRTGTLFLTPQTGDADKASRVKRQKRNSENKKRLSQSLQFKESKAAVNKKYRFPPNIIFFSQLLFSLNS